MTVHLGLEGATDRSVPSARRVSRRHARTRLVSNRIRRIVHLALALAVGLVMWIGIIAAAPAVFHLFI